MKPGANILSCWYIFGYLEEVMISSATFVCNRIQSFYPTLVRSAYVFVTARIWAKWTVEITHSEALL